MLYNVKYIYKKKKQRKKKPTQKNPHNEKISIE